MKLHIAIVCLLLGIGVATSHTAAATTVDRPSLINALGKLTPQILERYLDPQEANALFAAFVATTMHYDFAEFGPRSRPASNVPAALRHLAGGQCDAAVEAFRRLAGKRPASSQIVNVNFNVYDPSYGLRGHTIAGVKLRGQYVLFDPTYGIVIETHRARVDDKLLSSPARKAYAIESLPDRYPLSISEASRLYENIDNDRFSAAKNGKPFLTARTPWLDAPRRRFGHRDSSSRDITSILGSHFDYIGTYLTPIRHEWRFRHVSPERRRVIFHLVDFFQPPVDLKVTIKDSDGDMLTEKNISLSGTETELEILLPLHEQLVVSIKGSESLYAAAFVDAVEVRPFPIALPLFWIRTNDD